MDAYSKIIKLYGMENITTEKVMVKPYIFHARFEKVDEYGWWNMDIIQTDAGTQITSKDFQEGLSVHEVLLGLVALYHQEMNDQVEVK